MKLNRNWLNIIHGMVTELNKNGYSSVHIDTESCSDSTLVAGSVFYQGETKCFAIMLNNDSIGIRNSIKIEICNKPIIIDIGDIKDDYTNARYFIIDQINTIIDKLDEMYCTDTVSIDYTDGDIIVVSFSYYHKENEAYHIISEMRINSEYHTTSISNDINVLIEDVYAKYNISSDLIGDFMCFEMIADSTDIEVFNQLNQYNSIIVPNKINNLFSKFYAALIRDECVIYAKPNTKSDTESALSNCPIDLNSLKLIKIV